MEIGGFWEQGAEAIFRNNKLEIKTAREIFVMGSFITCALHKRS
jgi:hypothetical protein